ncbi:hypothetical protein HYX13_05040 [Candidatus Woesearchaeota archaeon]|nr:hypothetical protein [Candidatus Woesearchaeota archaeon]
MNRYEPKSLVEIVRTNDAVFLDANIITLQKYRETIGNVSLPIDLLTCQEYMIASHQKLKAIHSLTKEGKLHITLPVFREVLYMHEVLESQREYLTKKKKTRKIAYKGNRSDQVRRRSGNYARDEHGREQKFRDLTSAEETALGHLKSLADTLQETLFSLQVYQAKENLESQLYGHASLADTSLVSALLEYAEQTSKQTTIVSTDRDVLLFFHEQISLPRYATLREKVSFHRYDPRYKTGWKWKFGSVLDQKVKSIEEKMNGTD